MTTDRVRATNRRPFGDQSRVAVVTTSWDDGHLLDLRLAELLLEYGLAATFYIAPNNREIPTRSRLTDRHITELGTSFEIGAHTLTHPRLTTLTDDAALAEILSGRQHLEDCATTSIASFCYPGGKYAAIHTQMVRDAGFCLARTIERHQLGFPASLMEVPTTFHAYRHLRDVGPALRTSNRQPGCALRHYLNWDEWAMAFFDLVSARGGLFHLWGHSWEIDERNDWDRLERVFEHISHRPDVRYVSNHELAHPSGWPHS